MNFADVADDSGTFHGWGDDRTLRPMAPVVPISPDRHRGLCAMPPAVCISRRFPRTDTDGRDYGVVWTAASSTFD